MEEVDAICGWRRGTGRRINEMRVEEAKETGAEILATVCPLCLISLDSEIKVLNLDNQIRVMDILELVRERMEPPPHSPLSPSLGERIKVRGIRG